MLPINPASITSKARLNPMISPVVMEINFMQHGAKKKICRAALCFGERDRPGCAVSRLAERKDVFGEDAEHGRRDACAPFFKP